MTDSLLDITACTVVQAVV